MIVLRLPDGPDGSVPMRRFSLTTGREVKPDPMTGTAFVVTEDEARELEREGWQRQASKVVDTEDLRKIASASVRRTGDGEALTNLRQEGELAALRRFTKATGATDRRIVVGEVDAGAPFGRVHVEHDQRSGDVAIDGVAFDLADNVDEGLATSFRRATAAFADSDQHAAEQNVARATISGLVRLILAQNGVVADGVRRQKFRTKYGV